MHNARHAKPASTARRILLGGLAAVTAAGLGTLAFAGTGNAATTHQPSALVRAIVSGATVGIDEVTYQARAVSKDKWTTADKRLCHGMATFPREHANVPTIRELALDATHANGWLQSDSEALAAYALAWRPYGKELRQVQWDCS